MSGTARDLLATIPGGRVIDLATGSGEFVATLLDGLASWTEIVGVDTDPALAKEFADSFAGTDGIRFEVMDALHPTYPPASFDTASVSNSLHHFARPTKVLRKMKALLRPGGTLIVSEMFRDRQAPAQRTHVALHHWCAEVDQLRGVVHRQTYTRTRLRAIIERLSLDELRTAEVEDTSSDPKDLATREAVDGAIERYLRKADGHTDLVRRGENVRRRLHAVGIHGATTLIATGRRSLT